MPEAMLPAIVGVVCSERGRYERAGTRGEHGANYADIDGLPVAAADGWLLFDRELMEIGRCRDGRADGRPSQHQPDEQGRCRGCTVPGYGTPDGPWPCVIAKMAQAAAAPHDND